MLGRKRVAVVVDIVVDFEKSLEVWISPNDGLGGVCRDAKLEGVVRGGWGGAYS